MIDASVEAGCSAAKFQTFKAKDVYVGKEAAGTYHLMGKEIPIYDLHVSLEMPEDWVFKLKEYCDQQGIEFFSAPIGKEATEMLFKAGSPAFKVSSYECTNLPFVKELLKKQVPIILSTGAAYLSEVEAAVNLIKESKIPLAMMQCLTKYPAPLNIANLAVMETFRNAFNVPVGFSDNGFVDPNGNIDNHIVPLEAAKAGADLFEIHITLDRTMPGPDHGFATEPEELKTMVKEMQSIRKAYNDGERFTLDPALMGTSVKYPTDEEKYVREFAYKCIFATKDISQGEALTSKNIGVLRPGEQSRGLEPKYYDLLIDNKVRAKSNIKAWQPLNWSEVLA